MAKDDKKKKTTPKVDGPPDEVRGEGKEVEVDPEALVEGSGKDLPAKKEDRAVLRPVDQIMDDLDSEVLSRSQKDEKLGLLTTPNAGDADRARAVEELAFKDLARAEYIADTEVAMAHEVHQPETALKMIHAKNQLRGSTLELSAKRRKIEIDNVSLQRQNIAAESANQLITELTTILKDLGVDDKIRDAILKKMAERAEVIVGATGEEDG